MLKRISVTGPESTGKSWLAASLASAFNEPWVPEFAREFLVNINRPYTFDDILFIAKAQLEDENKHAALAKEWLFCDTDFLVTTIWCKVKFGKTHPWIDKMADTHRYDHYLLCNTDLPWEADPLREHPDFRDELFKMYQAELESRHFPFSIISGKGQDRLKNALQSLQLLSF